MNKTKMLTTVLHWVWLVKRPMTMGVRVVVCSEDDSVLLVRHTYIEGWHLPGGGIETRETAADAAIKEVWEETGIRVSGVPVLVSIHKNISASKRDHVLLYRITEWEAPSPFQPNSEIAEARFFPVSQLPDGVTKGTRARIDEVFFSKPPDPYW